MEVLNYRNQVLTIIPGVYKGNKVFWLQVNGVSVTAVSNAATARRLGVNFVNVVLDAPKQPIFKNKFASLTRL